jgi:hypothetical protein
VLARHRVSGAIAGHTVVAVRGDRPQVGDQHDTTVVGAHRGHRLGLLLKADMMRWLRRVEPALETIGTQNAASNDHMIAVNERLGYRVLGRSLEFQRDDAPARDSPPHCRVLAGPQEPHSPGRDRRGHALDDPVSLVRRRWVSPDS